MEIACHTGYSEEEVLEWPIAKFARWVHFLNDMAKQQMPMQSKGRPF